MGRPKGSVNKKTERSCKVCHSEFMACRKNNLICSQKCRNDNCYGKYGAKCIQCGNLAVNFYATRCRECRWDNTRKLSSLNLKRRFMSQVNKTSSCWLWKNPTHKFGYGWVYFEDGAVLAHRLSYQIYVGEIPEGMQVLHKCDNPPCVYPEHLYLGTNSDNVLDKMNKSRWPEQKFKFKVPRTINWRKYVAAITR